MRLTLFLAAFALIPLGGFADGREAAPASDLAAADSPELKSGRERLDECRKLFRDGKQNEAVKLAMSSVDIFVAPYRQLRWIDVGAIETEKYRVVIHVNTTEDERAKVKEDIVRPYTFCVFPKEPNGKLLYVIDFEHGYKAGVLKSAALGRYSGGAHFNYGMISAKADFTTVRDAALKLIRTDTIKPSIR